VSQEKKVKTECFNHRTLD